MQRWLKFHVHWGYTGIYLVLQQDDRLNSKDRPPVVESLFLRSPSMIFISQQQLVYITLSRVRVFPFSSALTSAKFEPSTFQSITWRIRPQDHGVLLFKLCTCIQISKVLTMHRNKLKFEKNEAKLHIAKSYTVWVCLD